MSDRTTILQDVERILERFAQALEHVPLAEEVLIEADEETRDGQPQSPRDFRERFLANVLHDEEGFLLAERKQWGDGE